METDSEHHLAGVPYFHGPRMVDAVHLFPKVSLSFKPSGRQAPDGWRGLPSLGAGGVKGGGRTGKGVLNGSHTSLWCICLYFPVVFEGNLSLLEICLFIGDFRQCRHIKEVRLQCPAVQYRVTRLPILAQLLCSNRDLLSKTAFESVHHTCRISSKQ